jgi:hypothetical protein
VPLTKTTTRAFAASLAMVAAGGTIAGAAVFHLPILGINGAAASTNVAPHTAQAAAAAPKTAHRKVVVKTRVANVIVHVPAPTVGSVSGAATWSAPSSASSSMQPESSTGPHVSEPQASAPESTTTTSVSTTTTVGEHDDQGENEDLGQQGDGQEHEDAPEVPEHGGASTTTTTTTVAQP